MSRDLWVLDAGNTQPSVTVRVGGRGASLMAGCCLTGGISSRILKGGEAPMICKTSALVRLQRSRGTEDVVACAIAGAAAAMGPAVRQRGSLDADASQLCITCSVHSKCFACGRPIGTRVKS